MDTDYKHIPKTDQQLLNWFNEKVRQGKSNFLDFPEFKNWYDNSEKVCHYCGLTEQECQIIARTKLKSNRFPKDGKHGRGTSRGMWLEIDRYQPKGKYETTNIVLACYFCNNDKSDIFSGDQYKSFMKNRISFLKNLLPLIAIFLISTISSCNNNQNYEDRIKKLEAEVAKLDSSNSNSNSKQKTKESAREKQKNKLSDLATTYTDHSSIEKKFIGSWKFYEIIPDDKPDDHSMNGLICELEKYANTKETFIFHLWTGNDLILSIKDENTLVGQNANFLVKYNSQTDRISLIFSNGKKEVYSRLK